MTHVMQGPPPKQPDAPAEDPRPEQPHPIQDEPDAPAAEEDGEGESA